MELTKLFEAQKALRDRINYNEPDRFNKLILALLVELGECANEWRGFKFWSKNQQPRVKQARAPYMDLDDADFYNPLLEEYVDGLHFILELGLEFGQRKRYKYLPDCYIEESVTDQFRAVFNLANYEVYEEYPEEWFNPMLSAFIELGKMLGFTWEEVEQAYYAKNAINHHRQEVGY
jgi:dimeric dUTPase (all-alpha-NTP-PPase superfamily)